MSKVLTIEDDGQFYDLLEKEEYMVVKFTAPDRCAPCRAFRPHFEDVARLAPTSGDEKLAKTTFIYLNVDDFPDVAADYGIMSIPTVLLFVNGKTTNTLMERRGAPFLNEVKKALRS